MNWFDMTWVDKIWLAVGFIGQFIFGARFIIQWIVSEKRKESVIPPSFWYLSIVGSLIILAYACHKLDPVFMAGSSINSIIYMRNIVLINKKKLIVENTKS